MKIKENERLAIVEVEISELTADLKEVKADVKDIKKCVLDSDLTRRVDRLEKMSSLSRWLTPVLTAILTATVTFLVIEYFKLH